MKKSLIVATLAVLLSVNVLTPMVNAVGEISENEGGMSENGSGMTENNPENGGEGEDDVLLGGKEVAPTGSGTEDFYESEESSKNPQSGENLDSSVTPQNDGNDGQDSSLDAQNDNQDDTANPEDLLAMPLAGSMQFGPDPDPQPEEPLADPNADPATPDEDSDDTSTQTVKDLHLYFVNGSETKHYTIMDRNMGATEVLGEGHYYQWGNNYGFTYPLSSTSKTRILYDDWKTYEDVPSTYSSETFITPEKSPSNWQDGKNEQKFNSNLWGGKNDTTDSNGEGAKTDRQGPCPDGYYVPSAHDANTLVEKWKKSTSTDSQNYYTQFATDLLITRSMIDKNGNLEESGQGRIWTSSPAYGIKHNAVYEDEKYDSKEYSNHSRTITFVNNQFNIGIGVRANGYQVRCFKNDFNPDGTTGPLTIHLNGGEKAVIAVDEYGLIHTLNTPSYPNDEKEFKGWYTTENFLKGTKVEKDDNLNGATDLYARWEGQEESFVVTFKNYDGTVLQTGAVISGSVLSGGYYTGAEPTKPFTAQTGYYFTGWTPDFAPITGETTYTAKFEERVNKYKVTFVDEDGTTVLQEATEYDYGTASGEIVKPADPTKEADAQYTYTFAGWTPELAEVTADATYTATYTPTLRSYTITWKNDDGSVIDTMTVEYGEVPTHADATKENTAEWTYTFSGWTPEVVAVTGDATYKATFNSTKNSYTITWLNDDDTQIDTTTVEYGVVPTHADATKENTAEYTYIFSGWTPEVVAVTGDATYKATFSSTKNKYKVTFKNADGNVISEKEVEYGQTPTAPADQTKEGHTFAGWSPAIGPVTGPVDYEPIFTINKHIVTWQNYDGDELEKDVDVDYGTTPAYDGATPTRDADAQYTYTFAAWSPAISTVKGDIVYTATYSTTVNEYTITFLDEDGAELYKYSVPYGMMPLYTGDIPTKEADSKYTYTFAGWTPSLAAVTGEATYTVKFNSKKKGGNRSGGGKGGNSDSNTHGSADEQDSSTTSQNDSSSLSGTDMNDLNGEAQELFDVHKWAYENGLTRYANINDARMNDPINRAEMAKISSIFDINFLGKTPDESKEYECSQYSDISIPDLGEELRYFVVQSCELGNMGYSYDNMNYISDFMPYDPLNVAQASVILSRMAWGKRYIIGPEMWYQGHIYAVYDNALLDDTSDPWRHITRREAFTAFYRLDNLLNKTN